jgi:predicted AAA+ superfamily ATPase
MDGEALRKAALRWEREHGSRTPRTARQFADNLAAGLSV